MMKTNQLHLMNAAAKIPPGLAAELHHLLQQQLCRQAQLLNLGGVDVAVYVSPWTLPETGVGGYAPLGHWVQVTLTPDHPSFAACWRQEVPATLAHELHHARRWQGVGYGRTLLEVMVSEGLAQHHELRERGGVLPPYSTLPGGLDSLWARAEPLLDREDYDHNAWFYGSAAQHLPRWAGYALGFELVQRYLASEGGDAATCVDVPAAELRTFAGP